MTELWEIVMMACKCVGGGVLIYLVGCLIMTMIEHEV